MPPMEAMSDTESNLATLTKGTHGNTVSGLYICICISQMFNIFCAICYRSVVEMGESGAHDKVLEPIMDIYMEIK